MKSKISRILGVGITVAVLASMLVVGGPASAGTLAWSSETVMPFAGNTDILDIAVAGNGTTVYAAGNNDFVPSVTGNQTFVKSTNSGASWTGINFSSSANVTVVKKVAVAPDLADGSFLTVIASAGPGGADTVLISSDGGATWSAAPGPTGAVVLRDIAVSPPVGTVRSLAVAADAGVFTLNLGGLFGGSWLNASTTDPGFVAGSALAVGYSPNFAGDRTLVVVTSGADTRVQLYNTTNRAWNGVVYGASWTPGAAAGVAASAAALALSPTFLGADANSRVVYVGNGTAGLYRVGDPGLSGTAALQATASIYSVALNTAGDKLVAGTTTTGTVYRIASPATASAVAVAGSAAMKGAGVDAAGMVVVAFAGTDVVAGNSGPESAFSISKDDGKSFNGISLVDSSLNAVDFSVAADGSKIYVASVVGGNLSLWRKATAWERVLISSAGAADYVVRNAPDNADVVYVGVAGGAGQILYSNDGGQTTWLTRFSPHTIVDLAVESAAVVYVLNNNAQVSKSIDSGFIWDNPLTLLPSPFTTAAGGTISVIGASNVVVGGGDGAVAYSTDGAATWTRIAAPVAGVAKVTASGLASGGFIYATTSNAAGSVYRWTIGTSTSWTNMLGVGGVLTNTSATPVNITARGIALVGGALYVVGDDGAVSTLYRTITPSTAASAASFSKTAATGLLFGNTPNALMASVGADKNPKLWALNAAASLQSFTDILVTAVPTLSGPADKYLVPINLETGNANDVVFQWTGVTGTPVGTSYTLQVALDSAFTQVVKSLSVYGSTLAIIGPTGIPSSGTLTPAGAMPFQADTTYYWRVRIDGPVFSNYSTARSFKIDALRPLSLQAPASGAMAVSVSPTFVWSPVQGATTYELVVSDDPTFAIITFSRTTSQPVFASDEQLAYSTVYYWRVRASAPATAVTPFQTGIFTTEDRPPAPTTATPPVTVTQTSVTITVPPAETVEVIPSWMLWIIIGIGAILVIALLVLIVRTRRTG